MKRFLIYHLACWMSAMLLLLAVRPAVAQTVDWVADIGRGQSGWSVTHVVADAAGNSFVCGSLTDSLTIGAFTLRNVDTTGLGRGDGFVARLDANGICQWVAHISGQNGESAQAIALDPAGNVLVTGSYWSYDAHFGPITLYNASAYADLFVAKLDGATGQWLWARRMGGTGDDFGMLLKTDAAGDVYVAGTFASDTLRTGGTPAFLVNQHYHANTLTETVVAKFSGATGQCLWATRAGVNGAATFALDDHGHVFLAGSFIYTSADIGSTSLTTYSAGSGTSYVVNRQCYVARLAAATGAWQWATQGGDSNQQYGGAYATGLRVDGQGIITVVGGIDGFSPITIGATPLYNQSWPSPITNRPMTDGFVARLDSTGQWLNAFSVGGQGDEWLRDITSEPGGGLLVLGFSWTTDPISFGTNTLQTGLPGSFLARVDPVGGTWQDAAVIGSGAGAQVKNVALDAVGRRYIGGGFRGTLQLGSTTLTTPSNPNGHSVAGFLVRLSAGVLATPGALAAVPTGLQVWPNPTTSTVQVSGPAPGQRVQLVDVQGRCVVETLMPATGPLTLVLPAGLAAGLYVVRVPGTRQVRRLVVE